MDQTAIRATATALILSADALLARNNLVATTLVASLDARIDSGRDPYNPATVAVIAIANAIGRVGRRRNRDIGNTVTRRGNAIRVTLSGRLDGDADALENLEADLNLVALGSAPVYSRA